MVEMGKKMEAWVGNDAPVSEMTRPLSALCNPWRTSFFTDNQNKVRAGSQGAMAQKMNKVRKREANINMTAFLRLKALGMGVKEMADTLGVSTRSVDRANARVRRDVF